MDDQPTTPSSDHEAWLLISQAPGIGSRTFLKLLSHFGTVDAILSASATQLREAGIAQRGVDYLSTGDRKSIQPSLDWINHPDHHLLTLADPLYPVLLAEIHDPPPILFVHGNPELLSQPQLAIVGSRNPTPSGISNAREFAS
ncbi:MAG: DNA-processing protein DprA, partial [Pseudomonadota bacterium]